MRSPLLMLEFFLGAFCSMLSGCGGNFSSQQLSQTKDDPRYCNGQVSYDSFHGIRLYPNGQYVDDLTHGLVLWPNGLAASDSFQGTISWPNGATIRDSSHGITRWPNGQAINDSFHGTVQYPNGQVIYDSFRGVCYYENGAIMQPCRNTVLVRIALGSGATLRGSLNWQKLAFSDLTLEDASTAGFSTTVSFGIDDAYSAINLEGIDAVCS